jgi:alpha-amylase
VHKYFSPYDSPYDAFVAFMKVLQDLEQSLVRPTPAPAEPLWLEGAEMACVA